MRTKTLLLAAAAIVAGIASSQAQSNVYSVNIVGYVNVPLQGGNKLDILDYPLLPPNANYNITNVIHLADANDGAFLYKWAGTAWNNTVPSWIAGFGWDTELSIGQGEAYYIQAPAVDTVTFVGEVHQGLMTNTIPLGISFQANKVPDGSPWPGALVGNDGDFMYTWTGTAWNNIVWSYIGGYGWDDGGNGGSTNGPAIPVGRGVSYVNLTAPLTWTVTFTVP